MRRGITVLATLALFGFVATSCGSGGSPPTEAGIWAVWSPEGQVDEADAGLAMAAHANAVFAALDGNEVDPVIASELLPGLFLMVNFDMGPESKPLMVWNGYRLECGSIVFTEEVEFDPPLEVASDGAVSVEAGVLQWEGTFSGLESFSGNWTAGDCSGSWNATGESHDDLGVFSSSDG